MNYMRLKTFLAMVAALATMSITIGSIERIHAQEVMTVAWIVPTHPSLVRFTGTLFEPDQDPEEARSAYTFEIFIEGKKTWVFVIDSARNISAAETELGIMKSLFPRRLFFWGPKEVLDSLRSTDVAGKPITMLGHLYRGSRRYQVSSVEVLEEE